MRKSVRRVPNRFASSLEHGKVIAVFLLCFSTRLAEFSDLFSLLFFCGEVDTVTPFPSMSSTPMYYR